jgi:predicted RNA-binding protein YlxR (DUF448 family)
MVSKTIDVNAKRSEAVKPLPLVAFYHPFMTPSVFRNEIKGSPLMTNHLNLDTGHCIVNDCARRVNDMVRVLLSPDKIIVADLDEKLPGQFVTVTVSKETFKRAVWRNSFTTAFREKTETPSDFVETLELNILKKCLQLLGLCKKAGLLTHGFAKCEEWFHQGQSTLYVAASDASDNGVKKLDKPHKGVIKFGELSSAQLSAALGEQTIMHVALRDHALSDQFKIWHRKLSLIRGNAEPETIIDTRNE